MAQEVRRRKHVSVAYSANNKVSEQLSRGMIFRQLMLNLSGAITTSAGGDNDAADVRKAGEWGAVQRIDIIANGSDVIKSISGEALWWLNRFMFGQAPEESALIGAGGDDPTFDSTLILPFWMPRAIKPFDTALDARRLSDLRIEVTWGDQNDVLAPAGASAFGTAPTLDVYSLESFNPPSNVAFNQWRVWTIEETITAAATEHQIKLPVGHIYRGFLINTYSDDVDVATILNNAKLRSGTTVFADVSEEILKADYVQSNGVAPAPGRNATKSSDDGWYMLDLVTDGRLAEGIDTLGFSELELVFDVNAPGTTDKIKIWPQQIIPVRGGG